MVVQPLATVSLGPCLGRFRQGIASACDGRLAPLATSHWRSLLCPGRAASRPAVVADLDGLPCGFRQTSGGRAHRSNDRCHPNACTGAWSNVAAAFAPFNSGAPIGSGRWFGVTNSSGCVIVWALIASKPIITGLDAKFSPEVCVADAKLQ